MLFRSQSGKVKYVNDQLSVWQIKNIFGPTISKFGVWQVELQYQNLGRSNYEKWKNYDNNVIDIDTNNFTHFGGLVQFNICRPFIQSPPKEYIDYCNEHKITPYGPVMPIGNFNVDITSVRQVFKKNVNIKNNRI